MKAIVLGVFLLASCVSLAGETISEFGQIIYSKEQSSYYFVFQRDNLTYAYQIPATSKGDRDHLKSLIGKMIRVNGRVNFVRT